MSDLKYYPDRAMAYGVYQDGERIGCVYQEGSPRKWTAETNFRARGKGFHRRKMAAAWLQRVSTPTRKIVKGTHQHG